MILGESRSHLEESKTKREGKDGGRAREGGGEGEIICTLKVAAASAAMSKFGSCI